MIPYKRPCVSIHGRNHPNPLQYPMAPILSFALTALLFASQGLAGVTSVPGDINGTSFDYIIVSPLFLTPSASSWCLGRWWTYWDHSRRTPH